MKVIQVTVTYGERTRDTHGNKVVTPEAVRSHDIIPLAGDLLDLDPAHLHAAVHKAYVMLIRDLAAKPTNPRP
jgi:hypothetical protein